MDKWSPAGSLGAEFLEWTPPFCTVRRLAQWPTGDLANAGGVTMEHAGLPTLKKSNAVLLVRNSAKAKRAIDQLCGQTVWVRRPGVV